MEPTPAKTRAKRKSSAQKVRPQGILVLGMHRSGTSAMTRALNLLGCALPANVIGAGDGNEHGHWESVDAVALNDEILASAGSRWDDWGPINDDWHRSGVRNVMLERVEHLVKEHVALGPLFVIKDPRLCRIADVWLEGMDAAGVEARTILMVRNPEEVSASLESRDLMTAGYGELLWLRHVLDAEYYSRGRQRIICRYDQLLGSWRAAIERIKSGLGVAFPRNAPAVHAEIDAFLDTSHRHHQAGVANVASLTGQSDWINRAFAILTRWSEDGESPSDHAELDAIRAELGRAYAPFARLLLATDDAGEVGSGSQLKRELTSRMNDANAAIQEAEAATAHANARTDELEQQIAAKTAQAGEIEAELQRVEEEARLIQAKLESETAKAQAIAADRDALRQDLNRIAPLEELVEQLQSREVARVQDLEAAQSAKQTLELRVAELTGQVTASESALAQRREELAQLWDRMLLAEKAASTAEAEAAKERERRDEAERAAEAAKQEQVDLQARLQSAIKAAAEPPPQMVKEIAQLTQMLREQETATAAASEAAERAMADRLEEAERTFTARLTEAERAATAAEQARASTEHKLAARFDEIARITAILADEGRRADQAGSKLEWLAEMAKVAESFPKWWALMPAQWRQQREHRRYRNAGLFDAQTYLETYPDVAAHGMDPVRHYLLHGMTEGRLRT